MSWSTDEKIEIVKEEIRQLENRAKRLEQSHSYLERKARAHRLIERGAILESLIPSADTLTNEQIKFVLEAALGSDAAVEMLLIVQKQAGTS